MRFWGNVIGYQLVWFCAVIAAARGLTWPGALAFALFAAWQLASSRHRTADMKLIAMCVLIGVLVDGTLSRAGWAVYATSVPALPRGGAPIWILSIWASFALTLNETLHYLQKRLWPAAIFGAVGGPMAYLGASHGWHALTFIAPRWRGLAALAIGWGFAMPLLARMARHWSRPINVASLVMPVRAP